MSGAPDRHASSLDDDPAPGRASVPLDALRYAELDEERRQILLHVSELIDAIDFGTVVLVMHEGRVVQVETSEKIRL